jgi:hypothetical protein
MRRPSSIIVVGSSGNGKTTLVNGLRAHDDQFIFPKRFITRPRRKGDDLVENEHVRPDRFDHLLGTGGIGIAWSRPLGKTRVERYGFESTEPDPDRIVVYSANNALLRDENAMVPSGFFEDCFIVLVKAPDDIRRDRMFGRSPDIAHEEMDIRIRDNGLDLVPKAHLVIDTHSFGPDHAVALVRRSVDKLE